MRRNCQAHGGKYLVRVQESNIGAASFFFLVIWSLQFFYSEYVVLME